MKFSYTIKSLFVFIICLIFTTSSFAGPGSKFDRIVFFGDSLSDNGNLAYWTSFIYQIPQEPAYYKGRFSNGPVWSEHFSQYFTTQNKQISTVNYAYGGESIILHNPLKGYLPYAISASYYSYLAHTLFSSRDTTLFVILIGANDYLNGVEPEKVDEATTKSINHLKSIIDGLIYHGGKNFLIINLPDLSKTPMAIEEHRGTNLKSLSEQHDNKLKIALDELINSYKQVNIQLFNLNPLFDDFISNIEKYNQKYGTDINNTTKACWSGGYTNTRNNAALSTANEPLTKEKVLAVIMAHQNQNKKQNGLLSASHQLRSDSDLIELQKVTPEEIADAVVSVPTLREAFTIGQLSEKGIKPCTNEDNYMFWDHVHPTRVIHKMISEELIAFVNQQFQHI